ncbi:hypothetical protein CLOM_g21033 [Closterium sp. NIES-68]|nr:hypothetical protein CLOM_g21033 [Closterium sp. NIES-68]GJP74538.1 hypothetical protein CLOP_g5100 [Closterium sp. NIES-67]
MARSLSSLASPPLPPPIQTQPPRPPHSSHHPPPPLVPSTSPPVQPPLVEQPPPPSQSPSSPVQPPSVPAAASSGPVDVAGLAPFIAGTAACMLAFFAVGILLSFALRCPRLLAALLPNCLLVILVRDVDDPDGTAGRRTPTSHGDKKSRGLDPATLETFPIVTFRGLAGGSGGGRAGDCTADSDKENGHCSTAASCQPVRHALPLGEAPAACFGENRTVSNSVTELAGDGLAAGKGVLCAGTGGAEAAAGFGAGERGAAERGAEGREVQGGASEREQASGGMEAPAGGEECGEMGAVECAVCLNEFTHGDQLRRLLPCGHGFHVSCIDCWLASHTTCPVCRTSLEPTKEVEESR